jgi:hypothetical protein
MVVNYSLSYHSVMGLVETLNMMDSLSCIIRMVTFIMETYIEKSKMVKEFITRIMNNNGTGISIHMER